MLAGDFQAKLRKCNRKLRVYAGNDDSKPAGIFHVTDPENSLVGIDKNFVPEWPIYDELSGRILKGGWRRAIQVLIGQKYIDRKRAQQVFGVSDIMRKGPAYVGPAKNRYEKEIEDAYTRNMSKIGKPALTRDDVMDLAREITKHESK